MNKKEIRVAFYGGMADYHIPSPVFNRILGTHRVLIDYEKPDLLVFDANNEWRKGFRRHPNVPAVMFSGENITAERYTSLKGLSPAYYLITLTKIKQLIPSVIKRSAWYRALDKGYVWMTRHAMIRMDIFGLIQFMRAFLSFFERKIGRQWIKSLMHLYQHREWVYMLRCLKGNRYHLITSNALARGAQGISFPFFLHVAVSLEREQKINLEKPLPSSPNRPFFCLTAISNYRAFERLDFFYRLSRYRPVVMAGGKRHQYSHPYHSLIYKMAKQDPSIHLPLPTHWFDLIPVYKRYKFVICFENSRSMDYISEKLLLSFLSGAIPIYWGAPNVEDYFNPDRFIHYKGSYDAMVKQVKALDQDDAAYAAYCAQPIVRSTQKALHQHKWQQLHTYFGEIVKQIEHTRDDA